MTTNNQRYQLHGYTNMPTSAYIQYSNGSIIKLYGKVDSNILCGGNKQKIMQAYRKYLQRRKCMKSVSVNVACDVYSTFAKTWRHIDNESMFERKNIGYTNVSELLQYKRYIFSKNSGENIKNLQVKFTIKINK